MIRLPASFRLAPVALSACLLFGACAPGVGGDAGLSPAQQSLEQSKRRFVTTTAEGAVGGAALGALVGGLTHGTRGALIGAAAGGALGGVAGYAVAQNNYSRSHTEVNLNAAVDDANQQAAQARQDATRAQQIASEARAASARLQAQYRAGQINASQYRSGLASYQTSLASLQELSKGYGDQITQMRQNASYAPGSDAASLRSSSSDIQSSKATVDRSIGDLYQTLAAAPA